MSDGDKPKSKARRGMAEGTACVQAAAQLLDELVAMPVESQHGQRDSPGCALMVSDEKPKFKLLGQAKTVKKAETALKKVDGQVRPSRPEGKLPELQALADEAVAAGLMSAAARPAAASVAKQIARLESRFEQYYRMGEEDEETRRAQSTPDALDRMGKCEKQLADLKARFFEMTGLDRSYAAKVKLAELQCQAAEKGGEVLFKLEGFGEVPMQEE